MNKILLTLLLIPIIGYAVPIHKWIDKNGVVHYSNVSPAGSNSQVLVYQGVGNTSQATKKDESDKKEELDPDLKKKLEAEKETSRQNCIRAKESFQMLESGVRISRINAKGEKENLDEKGRSEELGRAKNAIKDWCEDDKQSK